MPKQDQWMYTLFSTLGKTKSEKGQKGVPYLVKMSKDYHKKDYAKVVSHCLNFIYKAPLVWKGRKKNDPRMFRLKPYLQYFIYDLLNLKGLLNQIFKQIQENNQILKINNVLFKVNTLICKDICIL